MPRMHTARLVLPASEYYAHASPRAVDFGAGWFNLDYAFGQQRAHNLDGMSPPYCSEF